MRKSSIWVTFTVAAILVAAALTTPGASARAIDRDRPNAWFYIVHGLPGEDLGVDPDAPVDVLFDGEDCVLKAMPFGDVAGRFLIEPGVLAIRISHSVPEDPCGDTGEVLVDDLYSFEAGDVLSLVAHLDAGGEPTATMFVDDLSMVDPAGARLVVHHTAALPAVNFTVRRSAPDSPAMVFPGATNGDQQASEARWGAWELYFGTESADKAPQGPVPLLLYPLNTNRVYVVGSEANDTLTLIRHRIRLPMRFGHPRLDIDGPNLPGIRR
jgi:hypothetical protein